MREDDYRIDPATGGSPPLHPAKGRHMGRLVSVNVGMPKDVQWQGKTVRTGIWKAPVDGPVMVRRLNVDGDGQGDLGGHGGEQRAVMVYQTESYEFWKGFLNRSDLVPGNFGENFTVTGLADADVCIGDRYRIGEAEFEVTQPRVTCFRVGMRLGEPRMPNLLVSQHRPGFYLRVLSEGRVCAGDEIVLTERGRHELSVADVDALLYLPGRDLEQLHQIVDVPALSPGWQQSFTEMLAERDVPAGSAVARPTEKILGWTGFRPLQVTEVRRETASVLSMRLVADDSPDVPLPSALPGQYLTVRVPGASNPAPLRSYSLSGDPRSGHYRIAVKREEQGLVSQWLHTHVDVGSVIEAAAPRGDFYLTEDGGPVVLISAGIGVTPVLAMLHALSAAASGGDIWWLHTTRSPETEAFAAEAAGLIEGLPHATRRVIYTQTQGRLDRQLISALGLPAGGTAYLCGPTQFMADTKGALLSVGFDPARIHSELFGARPPINPGLVAQARRPPHQPAGPLGTGPSITFARSGLTANWAPEYQTILDFAESCDVPTRFSCRSGVCQLCVTGVVAGETTYVQPPLELPKPGEVLICSAAPATDLVLDL